MLSDYLSLSVVDVILTVADAPKDYSEAITAYCETSG